MHIPEDVLFMILRMMDTWMAAHDGTYDATGCIHDTKYVTEYDTEYDTLHEVTYTAHHTTCTRGCMVWYVVMY